MGTGGLAVTSYVRNTSQQPVYGLRLYWLTAPGTGVALTEALMPGEEFNAHGPTPHGQPFASTAFFRDRAGVWWQTAPDGMLQEVEHPPLEDINEPANEAAPNAGE